jgi:hypothetical protein
MDKKKTREQKDATKYPLVSYWSQFMRWFLLIAIIGLIIVAHQFYTHNPEHKYWQIGDVVLWIGLSVILISSITALFGQKKYTITKETLIISNYFHWVTSIISRSNLLSYYEDLNKNKNDVITSRTLRIKTSSKSIKINSNYYNNYKELKNELKKGLIKDKEGELRNAKTWTLGFGIGMILFSTLIIVFSVNPFKLVEKKKAEYFFSRWYCSTYRT